MSRFECSGISADSFASSGQLGAASEFFIREGYAILDGVLPRAVIEDLRRAFEVDYAAALKGGEVEPALQVGDRRRMISIRFSGAFASPLVFANPFVVALIRHLLEPAAILEAYGCVLSLPGATRQHLHSDGPHLFGTVLSAMLPPFALTVGIPLVEMNEERGSTRLAPGSHRWPGEREDAATILPVVPPGSCLLWDFRLKHFGTENRSAEARPMLYCTFARPWYKDPFNFRSTPRLKRLDMPPRFVETLPEDVRGLLRHALEGAPVDGRA